MTGKRDPYWNKPPKQGRIKAICYKCGYFNPEIKEYYRCRVPGGCPAIEKEKAAYENEQRT